MIREFLDILTRWSALDTRIAVTAATAAMACALPGVWLLLRRQSMLGDALSHTALPGVVIAFLAVHVLEARGWLPQGRGAAVLHMALLAGAIAVGVLTSLLTEWVQRLGQVESSAALGVVFTCLFALGLFLLRLWADSVHIDPDCVLFGVLENVAWEEGVPRAVIVNGTALAINLALLLLFYKELTIAAFDPGLATSLGINARAIHYGLMAATAVTVVSAFETVGSILVVGLLIVPAATAFLLTRRLRTMIVLSLVVAALSAVLGHVMAKTLPAIIFPRLGFTEVRDARTSGMVAVAAGLLFVSAWLFSPKHGLIGSLISRLRLALRIAADDLLGLLYRLEERKLTEPMKAAPALVAQRMGLGPLLTRLTVWDVRRRGLVTVADGMYRLTAAGRDVARSLVRAHRLWETYLQKHFDLPADHLHAAAHRAEHFIDPDVREELAAELDAPGQDPHGTKIPAG